MPGYFDRYGDGWKLSVRIRIAHAQVRRLLNLSEEWDAEDNGTRKLGAVPLSAAHMALASAAVSARLLLHAERMGVPFSHFKHVVNASFCGKEGIHQGGISFRLPDPAHSEESHRR